MLCCSILKHLEMLDEMAGEPVSTSAKTKFNVKLPFEITEGNTFRGQWKAGEGLHITT